MPIVLSTLNPVTGEIKVRYQEPYVTEGLNAKFAAIVPRGCYRGFRLTTHVTALTITIQADPTTLDHAAHYLTTDGHGLTIRRIGGDFSATLLPSQTYIIAILASYVVGSTTSGDIRGYTLAEYLALSATARNELVVLGTVVTPASGVIPAANISHARRLWAWGEAGQDSVPWIRLHEDPSFEFLTLTSPISGQPAAHWYINQPTGFGSWSLTTTDPAGENALTVAQTGAGALSPQLWQNVSIAVQPRQAVRARLNFKNLQISSAGSLQLAAEWADSTGALIALTDTLTIDTSVVDSSYRTIDNVFVAPTNAAFLVRVKLFSASADLTYASLADAFRINGFQAWLEPLGPLNNAKGNARGAQALITNFMRFLTGGAGGVVPVASDAVLSQTAAGTLKLGRADNKEDFTHVPPLLDQRGQLYLGAGLNSHGELARLNIPVPSGSFYTTLWASSNGPISFYIYGKFTNNELHFVYNASWNTGTNQWDGDTTSYRLVLCATGILMERGPLTAGSGSWADGSWRKGIEFPIEFFGTSTSSALIYMRDLIATQDEAVFPRVKLDNTNAGSLPRRTLLFETSNYSAGSPKKIRIYAAELVAGYTYLEVVHGCYWLAGSSLWVKDGASTESVSRWSFQNTDIQWSTFSANTGSFIDSIWQVRLSSAVLALGSALNWHSASNTHNLKRGVYSAFDQIWYAVGDGGSDFLESSQDGGRTWNDLKNINGLTSALTLVDISANPSTGALVIINGGTRTVYSGTYASYGTINFVATALALTASPSAASVDFDATAGKFIVCYRVGATGFKVDTSAAGVTWVAGTLPSSWTGYTGSWNPEITCIPGLAIAAFVDTSVEPGSPFLNVMRSTDGGATWANVHAVPVESAANLANGWVTKPTYNSVSGDWYIGVVAGTSATTEVFRSTDSGVSWTHVQTTTVEAGGLTYLLPFKAQDIQALDDLLLTSTDSGRTAYSIDHAVKWKYAKRNVGTTTRWYIRTGGGGFMLWNSSDKVAFASSFHGDCGTLV